MHRRERKKQRLGDVYVLNIYFLKKSKIESGMYRRKNRTNCESEDRECECRYDNDGSPRGIVRPKGMQPTTECLIVDREVMCRNTVRIKYITVIKLFCYRQIKSFWQQ